MPSLRTVFTDPLTGRIISAAEAGGLEQAIRSVYGGDTVERQILSFGRVLEDLSQDAPSNWEQRETQRGYVWDAGDDGLSLSALGGAAPPDDATGFRVIYDVSGDARYQRGKASTEFLPIETFPPDLDLLQGVAPTGIHSVIFEKAR